MDYPGHSFAYAAIVILVIKSSCNVGTSQANVALDLIKFGLAALMQFNNLSSKWPNSN